jgi:hypothetical protein
MKKLIKEWWWAILSLVVILALAVGLRLYHLNLIPVFADEAIYIRWSQIMGAEPTLRFLPLSDGKQPLFMWVLMFYVRRMADPLFAGRLLSVASGLGTMVGIFCVSYLLFKNKLVSLISTAIYALSPFTFFFDRMALVDSMLATFGIWTLFFGILTAKTRRLDMAMITGFCLGGALLTKSPALFFTLLLPTTWIFIKKPKDLIKLFFLIIVTYAIGYGMYNVLRLGPNFQLITSRNADYILPISNLWTNPKDPFIFHIKEIFTDWFVKMGPWPILGLFVIGLLVNLKKYWKETIILTSWFIIPLLVQSEYAKVFTVRYIIFTLPPLFILAASGLSLPRRSLLAKAGWIIFTLFVVLALKFNYLIVTSPENASLPNSERSGYLEEWTAGTGIKEIADYLRTEEQKDPKTKIVVGTEGYFGTLPDGLQMYLNDRPKITVIGTGLDFRTIPSSLLESRKAGNKTYFVVNKSRIKNYAEKLGLELVMVYPKAMRLEKSSKEYLNYGPQEVLFFYRLK